MMVDVSLNIIYKAYWLQVHLCNAAGSAYDINPPVIS